MTNATVPRFAVAGAFLEALADADFNRLSACLDETCTMRALLPSGHRDWDGATAIADQLAMWFGAPARTELVDATVGEVGSKVHLRWRLRSLRSPEATTWLVVEQQAYVHADERIRSIDLLCSGFHPETAVAPA